MGSAGTAAREEWCACRCDRLRSGRTRLRTAAGPCGPRRRGLRKSGSHRRVAPLWHSRFQDGEAGDRPPDGADVDRRRPVPPERRSRQRCFRRGPPRAIRRGRDGGWFGSAARSSDPGTRPRRRSFRDGIPAAAEPSRGRRHGCGTNQGNRQTCRRDRRRRHGVRLHRHVEPARRCVDYAVRAPAAAARAREQAARGPWPGRSSFEHRRPRKKDAPATGRSRPSVSRGTTEKSRSSSLFGSSGKRLRRASPK